MIQYNYITSEFSYNHFKNVGYLKYKTDENNERVTSHIHLN